MLFCLVEIWNAGMVHKNSPICLISTKMFRDCDVLNVNISEAIVPFLTPFRTFFLLLSIVFIKQRDNKGLLKTALKNKI